jgi:hypothetical protein
MYILNYEQNNRTKSKRQRKNSREELNNSRCKERKLKSEVKDLCKVTSTLAVAIAWVVVMVVVVEVDILHLQSLYLL